jgi:hypothetical protein
VCNGRIAQPGEVDRWSWSGVKGEAYEFELRAGELGSRLDGVLSVCDAAGKVLASADTPAPGRRDPVLRFTAPADGTYFIEVRDRFRSRGGPDYAYRLRATRPAPDFRLALQTDARQTAPADAVSLPRSGQAKLKLAVERLGGFKEPIALSIAGLPEGVTFTPPTIAANQATIDLTFKADTKAAIRPARLTIQGSAKIGKEPVLRTAQLAQGRGAAPVDTVLLAVALPTPFKIKGEYDMGFASRGSTHKRRYTIEREGFDGPIEILLADRQARHLQGVTASPLVLPAGANEFTYEVTLPPWMETGRTSRACVMGVATLREPDGSEHRVSFSSINPNEQFIAVVGPGRLSLATEQTVLVAPPGQMVALPVQIRRGPGLQGDVKIELIVPAHIRGVTAEPVVIAAGQERGVLTLHFAQPLSGPFNMPLVVRASLVVGGAVAFAEAKVDIEPEP